MAADFLKSHGVNIDEILHKIQFDDSFPRGRPEPQEPRKENHISKIVGCRVPKQPSNILWDVSISNGHVSCLEIHSTSIPRITHLPSVIDAQGGLLIPSLCHAHVHLDKCFLLSDSKYSDLEIVNGDFAEAMSLTSTAKQRFSEDDLMRRGRRLIEESIEAGSTVMRAFVEVDEVVVLRCLRVGLKLKEEFEEGCHVQICAFAQLALFSGEDGGLRRRELMGEAMGMSGVDVIGSTPYVEDDELKMKKGVQWTIEKALETGKHMDLHLDYNIDPETESLVWFVLQELKRQQWMEKARPKQTICLGHCTRLTLFTSEEWHRLKNEIGDLPISFIGLPTSDLFMMGRPKDPNTEGQRPRGTLQILELIQRRGINGAIAINNVGNAFTPYGSCDPLALASMGVGIYQAATKDDTELLFEAVSSRAANAIGVAHPSLSSFEAVSEGSTAVATRSLPADFILFPNPDTNLRSPKTISEAVYLGGSNLTRRTIHKGRLIR